MRLAAIERPNRAKDLDQVVDALQGELEDWMNAIEDLQSQIKTLQDEATQHQQMKEKQALEIESIANLLVQMTETCENKDRQLTEKPNSAKAESCTRKCVAICIRGGGGAPGEGPLNVRKPLVVLKEGFRSRNYCLVECSEICNLIGDGDDGP
ncbi:hypothetical protein L7F22_000558 [Adiantum nelumboides]|nr:hypothetical protein [Adiantum nelumboides]